MKHNWEYKKLGEVCEPSSSNLMQKNLSFVEDGYEVYGAAGVLGKISTYDKEKSYIGIVKDGSGAGRVKIYPPKSSILSTMQYIQAKEIVYDKFLLYILQSLNLSKYTTGAAIPHIYFKDYKKEIVPVPNKRVQLEIVQELDEINSMIEGRKEQLKLLDQLTQSIFYEMFGDPISNPKAWEVKKVSDVVKFQRGYDLPSYERKEDGNIPIYGSNGIIGNHTEIKCNKGIITGRSGSLGKVYYSKEPFFPLNTTLFSVETYENNIIYLCYLVTNFKIERFGTATGVPTLNRNKFHSEKIIDVPLSLQNKFASKIEVIEEQKKDIESSIKELETLLASRMDYWFN